MPGLSGRGGAGWGGAAPLGLVSSKALLSLVGRGGAKGGRAAVLGLNRTSGTGRGSAAGPGCTEDSEQCPAAS